MQITGLLLFCLLRILAGIADSACMFDIRARRNNGSDIDDIDTGIFLLFFGGFSASGCGS
jgi:hypothetical protein